jgi:ribonuclease E
MGSKILINAIDPEECRIAKVKDNRLAEFHTESATREITRGNIYKGIITRVEPSLQAVFIDYGAERHGFLQIQEIHSDYFLDAPTGEKAVQSRLKRGQELIVQVVKDPAGSKGAMLSTFISMPGRFVVLMPGNTGRGISRKIESEEERKRLKEIVDGLNMPEDFGLIVRTAGESCTKTMLSKDVNYLMRLWRNIKKKVMSSEAPATLYKERNLAVRAMRDYFTPDVTEILIDEENVYREVKSFIHIISPKHLKNLKRYQSDRPIFTKFQLEDQIATIFESRVRLKSGGSLVIEQTEALVAIDVNSGKGTRKKDIEETALMTNMEAAEEIARQLQLRDLGGLIVIDFIDMRERSHRGKLEKAVRSYMRQDKARTKVGRLSRFGLMEMSRQRMRPPIDFGSFERCGVCRGKGQIPSTESLVLRFMRKLKLATLKSEITQVRGIVPQNVADYLLNRKRSEILELEQRRNLQITIQGDACLIPGDCEIVCE